MSVFGACARSVAAIVAVFTSTAAFADGGPRGSYPATTSSPNSIVYFSGFDTVKDASYMFQGAILALNRDIGRDGFVLRAYGSHVDYRYDNAGIDTSGTGWQGDAMLGYKVSAGRIWAAAYVGVDYQSFKLTPDDPTSRVRGSEIGLKVAGDIASLRNEGPVYFALSGNYSTAFESYWARARVGANSWGLTFGPEVAALGNKGFDATRVGGFVTFDLPLIPRLPLEVSLSAGHQFVSGNSGVGSTGGGEGTYFGMSFTSLF